MLVSRNDLIEALRLDNFSFCYVWSNQRFPLETISSYSPTMHWFAMVGEDETMIDLLDLGIARSLL